jgi:hypothetical protein
LLFDMTHHTSSAPASALAAHATSQRNRERACCGSVASMTGRVAMVLRSASRPFYAFVCWQTYGVCTVSDMTVRFFFAIMVQSEGRGRGSSAASTRPRHTEEAS